MVFIRNGFCGIKTVGKRFRSYSWCSGCQMINYRIIKLNKGISDGMYFCTRGNIVIAMRNLDRMIRTLTVLRNALR